MRKYFTSESVTEGHPDKVCDQISDAILDAILADDPTARVACETFATTGAVFVMGEITTTSYVDVASIVRKTIREIGYTGSDMGFDADTCAVITSINEQSPDIAMGVNKAYEAQKGEDTDPKDLMGAGDQGMVFGYANSETKEYMPLTIMLAHKLAKRLADVRKDGTLDYLRPDGKSQVTIEFDEEGNPKRVDSVLIAAQHDGDVDMDTIYKDIVREVIQPILPKEMVDENTKYYVNPTGRFEVGGPQGDTGLTGRKIVVDSYGGYSRVGGGAFSGKDPTKVDRSASYMARYIAKNLVAAGLCKEAEVGIAYAIGIARPLSVYVDTFGTAKIPEEEIEDIVNKHFDLRPAAIIETLDLRRPIYQQTAAYGHFGRTDLDLPWERLDRVEELKAYLK